ncbi:MAG: histidine kinase, partial [Allosphingosinicella sp.]
MLTLTPLAAALVALLCGAWLAAAAWATMRGLAASRSAGAHAGQGARAEALLAAAPALPLVVRADGRLEGSERAAFALGLTGLPPTLAELGHGDLDDAVGRTAASGASFALTLHPHGGARAHEVRGGPAPARWPQGSTLLWLIDTTDSADRTDALAARADRLAAALDALSGLIEAAPFPMWHRGPDLSLAMVNSAYVDEVLGFDSCMVIV